MKQFTFDVKMFATFRIHAPDEQTARNMIADLDGNQANFGRWPDGSPALAGIGMDGEYDLLDDDDEA